MKDLFLLNFFTSFYVSLLNMLVFLIIFIEIIFSYQRRFKNFLCYVQHWHSEKRVLSKDDIETIFKKPDAIPPLKDSHLTKTNILLRKP
jgi:hypothetical protein